jgi:flagellar biosynthetic protein FliP
VRTAKTCPRGLGHGTLVRHFAAVLIVVAAAVVLLAWPSAVQAQAPASQPASTGEMPGIGDVVNVIDRATSRSQQKDWSSPIKMAIVFAALALLPSALVMMTSFTRIVIVLGFIRRALTTQNLPPTVALVGLAVFLSLFTMSPTFTKINQEALQPYLKNKVTFEAACSRGNDLLKEFMIRQTRRSDLNAFVGMAKVAAPKNVQDVPTYVAIPAFAVSEFRTAFEMGCIIFIPFLLVDLVISAILLSAGMMMLPPSIISLPFKVILFVLVDGWTLLSQTLVRSFN